MQRLVFLLNVMEVYQFLIWKAEEAELSQVSLQQKRYSLAFFIVCNVNSCQSIQRNIKVENFEFSHI